MTMTQDELEERYNKALDVLVDALDEERRLKAIHGKTNPNHPDLVNARAAHARARKEYIAIADKL
jgi:hypothetical protein